MKSEKDIMNDWNGIEENALKEIEFALRKYDYNTQNLLASFIANICDVDVADMLSSTDKLYLSQVRWFFWYAYRYMTHETYERISERTAFEGHKFGFRVVAAGIERISKMIETEDIWKRRWYVIKKMIKLKKETNDIECNEKCTILIQIPDNVELEIKKSK